MTTRSFTRNLTCFNLRLLSLTCYNICYSIAIVGIPVFKLLFTYNTCLETFKEETLYWNNKMQRSTPKK